MKVIFKIQTNNNVMELPIENLSTIILGRSSRSDFKIPDELMSSKHLKIFLKPPKIHIMDLDSKNGTYLNGIRIESSDVFLGDEIKIGSTKISIAAEKMDANSRDALVFPGPSLDRAHHELRPDFTGARDFNQSQTKAQSGKLNSHNIDKEVALRKKAQSNIKLSKQEIKLRNKMRSTLSSMFDFLLMIFCVSLPLVITNILVMNSVISLGTKKIPIMFFSELIVVGGFWWVNFKMLKFSLGEKVAGIEQLYKDQLLG